MQQNVSLADRLLGPDGSGLAVGESSVILLTAPCLSLLRRLLQVHGGV